MKRILLVGPLFCGLFVMAAPVVDTNKPATGPAAVELFEDEADGLIPQLLNVPGNEPGEAKREDKEKYSGVSSIKVTPLQRYTEVVRGWEFPIVEKPGPGQFRFVRFAWKKVGGAGIMIQFCGPEGGWDHRYVAGRSSVPWVSLTIADKMPAEWTVVTRDLFKDFGAFRFTGVAFTPMDGEAGYYDHIYLGRTVEDLDRVGNGLPIKKPMEALAPARREQLWQDLASVDAAVAAPARWALVGGAEQTVPFLAQRWKHKEPLPAEREKEIKKHVAELDNDDFEVREAAEKKLAAFGAAALPLLRQTLQETNSAEVRQRVQRLIAVLRPGADALDPEVRQAQRLVRVLQQIGTDEARKVIKDLAENATDERVRTEARKALTP